MRHRLKDEDVLQPDSQTLKVLQEQLWVKGRETKLTKQTQGKLNRLIIFSQIMSRQR